MAVNKIDLGPTGVTVAHNIRRLREAQRLGYTELSRMLSDLGWEIAPLGLRRIEQEARRVDVDDLLALATALGVPPTTLLMPYELRGEAAVSATGIGKQTGWQLWMWLCTSRPPQGWDRSDLEFYAAAWPIWASRGLEEGLRAAAANIAAQGAREKGK